MEFRVCKAPENQLHFFAEPLDRSAICNSLLVGVKSRIEAGASGEEAAAATRKDIARNTIDAFRQTPVFHWLSRCDRSHVRVGGDFSDHDGLIPMPRILIEFSEPKLAVKFKISHSDTTTAPDHASTS